MYVAVSHVMQLQVVAEIKRKDSVVFCTKAENSVSAVQTMLWSTS